MAEENPARQGPPGREYYYLMAAGFWLPAGFHPDRFFSGGADTFDALEDTVLPLADGPPHRRVPFPEIKLAHQGIECA